MLAAACGTNSSNETTSQYIYDAALTTKVKAALASTPQLGALSTKVETANGVVKLSGIVKTADAKATATKVTSAVAGVKGVDNELEVEGQPTGSTSH
jgi:hyperosmotically inducible periplasmic protein